MPVLYKYQQYFQHTTSTAFEVADCALLPLKGIRFHLRITISTRQRKAGFAGGLRQIFSTPPCPAKTANH
jgi:hypothetical protein